MNQRNKRNQTDRQIRMRLQQEQREFEMMKEQDAFQREAKINLTMQCAKQAFYEHESNQLMSSIDFLFAQVGLIRKRWWVIQAILLGVLWLCIYVNGLYTASGQTMGVAAPLFGMIIIPELWKNRSCKAVEVEASAYYSLRQIFSARLLLIALVDLFLLSTFYGISTKTLGMSLSCFIVDFLIPLTVTCCICFWAMVNKHLSSEHMAILLCVVWSAIWMLLICNDRMYRAISLPVWIGVWILSLVVLLAGVIRSQQICDHYWEVEGLCN